MKVKQSLDQLFSEIEFNTTLYNKILINNTEYITRNQEHIELFGGRNIGCYYIKYTMYDKNIFYNNVFDMDYDDVTDCIDGITSIPANFKIARDDINLVTIYAVHRFLTNNKLTETQRLTYATEVLNYFSYRTLVLISSMYFIYPISQVKATSLTERLSGKYIIKKLKNWREYCEYRSKEFLDSKFKAHIIKLSDDKETANAVNDLYNRTKDTLKNIYSEFVTMLENDEIMGSNKATITDADGKDTIADRIDNLERYINHTDKMFTDTSTMVKPTHIKAIVDIINTISYEQLDTTLRYILNYAHFNANNYKKANEVFKEVLVNAVEYITANELSFSDNSDVVNIMNSIVGNVLYSRQVDGNTARVKDLVGDFVKTIYKYNEDTVTDRNRNIIRNSIYLYIVLVVLTEK